MHMEKEERIYIRVSADDKKRIDTKMAELGIRNRSAYVRKMALDGYCIHLDMHDIKELVHQLGRCGNNLNQIARRANTDGSIYAEDIRELQEEFSEIRRNSKEILEALSTVR